MEVGRYVQLDDIYFFSCRRIIMNRIIVHEYSDFIHDLNREWYGGWHRVDFKVGMKFTTPGT